MGAYVCLNVCVCERERERMSASVRGRECFYVHVYIKYVHVYMCVLCI